ncbi:HEAT repeat domain-containing protein [Nostoc parmelioides]|uniref:HEAT repeat domain-containing protein n=1 Tax=Nostoc parmelioides FACHB-3921 TaxID=2692909 RepID=A0ABR8BKV6_9NOSO|nr:HEAT repeat domain-containing protein [Nostoc parmelioides]MBD2254717.1 HEAT repeat domain-containing protein [Nostoc parmelioides FACHB-3921]
MGVPRKRSSVQIHEQGIKKLSNAKDTKRLTYKEIAIAANVDERTVKRFFSGEGVSKGIAIAIAKALDLELTDLIDVKPTTPPPETTATLINWREVCSTMLEPQRRITSNLLMQDESAKKERKQVYVPLALVQKTKTDKRENDDFSSEEGTRLYEPEYETQQRFEHEAFLTQILERGEGKTKGKQIAVIGEPGAGKTTLLQAIAFWVLEKDLGLPVWISLADLGRNGSLMDIQTYISNSWLEQAIPPTQLTQKIRDDFTNQIQQGRVWLLLDGVDEISGGEASQQPLEEIARQLTGWLARSSRLVLTCRLNVWQADRNALESFETYRLLDFDYPQQVHQFIDNWFVEEIEKGERLKTELDSSQRVRLQDMVQTPLRLALLSSIWQSEEGDLPETKAGLYHQCVQQFYKWKQNRFPTSIQEQRNLNQSLGRLALRDINEGGSRFRLRETFIIEELGYPDDETSLFYKALKLGWLNHVGIAAESPSKEKVYAFYHATFEEYFAALAVKDWNYFLNHVPENPEKGTYRIFEPQWKEVILLWLGRGDIKEEQKEEFIKALVEFDDGCNTHSQIPNWKGFYEYRAYFLAAAGIAEFKDCNLADTIVKQIVKWSFGYFDIQKQDWQRFDQQIEKIARVVLIETERKKVIIVLLELIHNSKDKSILWEAAAILGEIAPNNPTVIAELLELIRDSQDEPTLWKAAAILGKRTPTNPTVIILLLELIHDYKDEYNILEKVGFLDKIAPNHPIAITALEELIRDSQDESTLWKAAAILGEIAPTNPTVITVLLELIRDSQDKYILLKAADILKEIALNNPIAITALEELIRDSKNKSTLWKAVDILGEIAPNHPTAITALEELINDSQDEYTLWKAAESLGKIAPNHPTAITVLLEIIRNLKNEVALRMATESLVKIAPNHPTAVNVLENLIRNSKYEFNRIQAAEILVKIAPNNPIIINVLENLIRNSKDEYTHIQAAKVLGEIAPDNSTVITALLELICNSKDEFTRIQAVEILGEIAPDNSTVITALLELIRNSKGDFIRIQAVESLGKIASSHPTYITILLELILDYKVEFIRLIAASVLGKIASSHPTYITVLEDLIRNSKDELTRRNSADILGKIAPANPITITVLEDLIRNSKDELTRRNSADILGNIAPTNPITITVLEDLIRNSKDEYTRIKAASVLGKIAPANPTVIAALLELVHDSKDELTRRKLAESLGKIAPANPTVITALEKLIRDSKDKYTCIKAASVLGKIAPANPTVITALEKLIRDSKDEYICIKAASVLGKIAPANPTVIAALLELIHDSKDELTRRNSADILGKIAPRNPTVITGLEELIRDSKDEYTRIKAASVLGKIAPSNPTVITVLKKYLSHTAYEIIWHCTQTLTYPAFYLAWHQE